MPAADGGWIPLGERPGQEIADRDFLAWVAASGLLMAACTLAGFLYGLKVQGSLELARTYAFSTLVVGEVLKAFASRSRTRVLWELGLFSNARLAVIAIATISIQLLSHHWGFLESFLGAGSLSWAECLGILAIAAVPVTLLEVSKLASRWIGRRRRLKSLSENPRGHGCGAEGSDTRKTDADDLEAGR